MRFHSLAFLLSFVVLGTGLGCLSNSDNSGSADASAPDLAPATPDLRPAAPDTVAPDAPLSRDAAVDSLAVLDVSIATDVSVAADSPALPDSFSLDLGLAAKTLAPLTRVARTQGRRCRQQRRRQFGRRRQPGRCGQPSRRGLRSWPHCTNRGEQRQHRDFQSGRRQVAALQLPGGAGQIYAISELSGIVRGYVSAQSTVSPTNFTYQTDATTGTLIFTANSTARTTSRCGSWRGCQRLVPGG